MRNIKRDNIYILSIVLVAALSITLFFFPDAVKYPYSYNNLQDKKESIGDGNIALTQDESNIKGLLQDIESAKASKKGVDKKAIKVKRSINEDDFNLEIPSFLVSIEQQAYKDKLKLDIEYHSIVTTMDSEQPGGNVADGDLDKEIPGEERDEELDRDNPDEELDRDNPDKDLDRDNPDKDLDRDNPDKDLDKDNTDKDIDKDNPDKDFDRDNNDSEDKDSEEDSPENKKDEDGNPIVAEDEEISRFTKEEIDSSVIKIPGLNVTSIPIYIEGSYHDVRNYIKYLDEIGMIEPSSIEMLSFEKIVEAKIVLNVFHGEVL